MQELRINVANPRTGKTLVVALPATESDIEEVVEELGLYPEEVYKLSPVGAGDIDDWTSSAEFEYYDIMSDACGMFDDIESVSDLVEAITDAEDESGEGVILAACEAVELSDIYDGCGGWNYTMTFVGDTYEDYGRMIADSFGLPDWAEGYFDFESFGEDEAQNREIYDTSYGLLEFE